MSQPKIMTKQEADAMLEDRLSKNVDQAVEEVNQAIKGNYEGGEDGYPVEIDLREYHRDVVKAVVEELEKGGWDVSEDGKELEIG